MKNRKKRRSKKKKKTFKVNQSMGYLGICGLLLTSGTKKLKLLCHLIKLFAQSPAIMAGTRNTVFSEELKLASFIRQLLVVGASQLHYVQKFPWKKICSLMQYN